MFGSLSTVYGGFAPHTQIVKTLKEYKKPLPIGFLAYVLRRREDDVKQDLARLQDGGVVEIDEDQEIVFLS